MVVPVDAVAAMGRLGGVGDSRSLLRLTTRRRVRKALRRGRIVRTSRGRYALPTARDAHLKATAIAGVVALRSAAAHYGWEMKEPPPVPEIAVRRNRKLRPEDRRGVRILWTNVELDEVRHGVTTPLRTVIDCARHLPFDEALAIADSALRSGLVTRADLDWAIVRGAGAERIRRVLTNADGRAANVFESVTRSLCLDVGLDVEPQAPLNLGGWTIHPDLTVRGQRTAIEADSWTFHTTRRAHRNDCVRYNALVLAGWRVLRFTWEQAMHQQAYVRWVLRHLVDVEPDAARVRAA